MVRELKRPKGETLYSVAKHKPSFQKELQELVKRYRIPVPPAHTRDEFDRWSLKTFEAAVWFLHPSVVSIPTKYKSKSWTADYIQDRISFLEKYGFSIDMHGDAFDDLLLGKAPKDANVSIVPADWRTVGSKLRSGVSILLHEGASRKEVLDFIETNWKHSIRPYLIGQRKRSRALSDPRAIELVLQYAKQSVHDLRELLGESGLTKDECIAELMRSKHDKPMSAQGVHQTITRAHRDK